MSRPCINAILCGGSVPQHAHLHRELCDRCAAVRADRRDAWLGSLKPVARVTSAKPNPIRLHLHGADAAADAQRLDCAHLLACRDMAARQNWQAMGCGACLAFAARAA